MTKGTAVARRPAVRGVSRFAAVFPSGGPDQGFDVIAEFGREAEGVFRPPFPYARRLKNRPDSVFLGHDDAEIAGAQLGFQRLDGAGEGGLGDVAALAALVRFSVSLTAMK